MEISLLALGDRTENYTFRLFKSILEAKGYQVNLVYLNIGWMYHKTGLTKDLKEQLVSIIKSSGIVAVYVFTFNFYIAVEITRYIRANTGALIMWGGPHAIAKPDECASYADIVCINEGEEALIEIVEKYEKYGKDFDKSRIPNVAYMLKEEIKYNDIRRSSLSLDSLPYQDFSFIRHYYVNSENKIVPLTFDVIKDAEHGFIYVSMISRGCLFRCAYCLNSNENRIPYYIGRSVDNIIGELKEAKRQFNGEISSVMLYDDDFFALPTEYIAEFCSKYKEQINIPIRPLNASAASFTEEKLIQVKDAAATGVIVGIQTISKNGRKVYNNPATKERIIRIMEVMKKHPDMRIILHIILGNPYENDDDIAENLLFLNSLPKIYDLSPYQLIIYPGTKLFEKVVNDPKHQARAMEGYHLPYYFLKPELALWNYLAWTYLIQKKDFPWFIRYTLEKGYYSLLNFVVLPDRVRKNMQAINTAVLLSLKNYGILVTFRKIKDKLLNGNQNRASKKDQP